MILAIFLLATVILLVWTIKEMFLGTLESIKIKKEKKRLKEYLTYVLDRPVTKEDIQNLYDLYF